MSWKVVYFETRGGRLPVKEFMDSQERKVRSRIEQSITLLRNNGPFLKPPYMKKVQDNLYELRIKGQITIRIFYSPRRNIYYMLHAFKKKAQKIPIKELKIAIDRIKKII
jgi:phage-related protein